MKRIRKLLLIVALTIIISIITVKANNSDSITRSFIDYPKANENIKDNLIIQGWVMSKEANTSVEVYINDTKIDGVERKTRIDVIQAITGYGTIEENPTPGYYKEVDISDLPYGNNIVKIKVLKNENVILTDSVTFNHVKPKTLLHLDYPVVEGNYANESKLKIQGWVMSESTNPTVEVEIDGNRISEELDREVRSDVIKAITGYGTIEENPAPGYFKLIDVSNLNIGKHTIKVIAKNQSGVVLSEVTRNINIRAPKTLLHLDYPVSEGSYANESKLKIQGWVMSESTNPTVEVQIDGQNIDEALDRKVRSDVIKAITGYGTIEENPAPGYFKLIDVSNLNIGKHTIKVIAKNQSGVVLSEVTRNINIRAPKTRIQLDYPVINYSNKSIDKLKIQGWVMSESPNSIVEVQIDGNRINEELDRLERPDVIKAVTGYGTIEENPIPGYFKLVDVSKLTYGNHTIKIIAKNQSGIVLSELSRQFNITKPATKIYIQKPTNNGTVGLTNNIDGWVMSEESNVLVKLYIDNNEITDSISRVERPDVISAITGYGTIEENPRPGFTTSHSFKTLNDGKHVISARAFSTNNNQEITSVNININLKKYDSMIYLDYPSLSTLNSNEELTIQGWVITKGEVNTIKGYIDNNEISLPRVARPDVTAAYPAYNTSVNTNSGFNTKINVSNYSDGNHKLTIKLYDELGEVINTYTKNIQLFKNVYQGIDVSEHNGSINWTSVANSGINFAIIRIGYRGYSTGKMVKDSKFEENFTGAKNAGLKVGIYFFSQAMNYDEGVAEANKSVEWLNGRSIQYPIAFDTENSTGYPNGRADHLTVAARTDAARGFCNTAISRGYKASIYASRNWFYEKLNMVMLASYDEWLAHYTEDQSRRSNYTGRYQVWQYTSSGRVSGVNGDVDRNVSYYNYQ